MPPGPPLVVGLLVTGVLVALGPDNPSCILLLTPVEAMLLAAFASWHPHDGRSDWTVPPLIQAAEYAFLADIWYACRRHSARSRSPWSLPPGCATSTWPTGCAATWRTASYRRGFGWEGRMIIAGAAAAVGIAPVADVALAIYLWWRIARDWVIGWKARHPLPSTASVAPVMNELAAAAGQEQHSPGDLLRRGMPAQRDHAIEDRRRDGPVRAGGRLLERPAPAVSSSSMVPGWIVLTLMPLRRELGGDRPHQPDLAALPCPARWRSAGRP